MKIFYGYQDSPEGLPMILSMILLFQSYIIIVYSWSKPSVLIEQLSRTSKDNHIQIYHKIQYQIDKYIPYLLD